MKLYFSKYSLSALAEMSNQDKGGLSKVMAGIRRPSVEVAHILADALNVSVLLFLAPGWYDIDGKKLPPSERGSLRAWKYGKRVVTQKNRKLLTETNPSKQLV